MKINRKKSKVVLLSLLVLCLIFSNTGIKAQQNQILFFGFSIREDLIDIYYETDWGNTTISLKDNGTQLFLESEYTNFAYEGNSTWIYGNITGVHYIEACIYNGVLEQFTFGFTILVQTLTNVDSTITKSIDAVTLAVIILCSLGTIVIISTIVIVIIKTRKIKKEEESL